jgi:hypothetical protein
VISKFENRPWYWSDLSLALKEKLGLLDENEFKKLSIHDLDSMSLVITFGVEVKTPTKTFSSFLLKDKIYEPSKYNQMIWSR